MARVQSAFKDVGYSGVLLASKQGNYSRELPALILNHTRTAYQRVGQPRNLNALSLSRNAHATDPRDKVFSIMPFSVLQQPTK